MMDDDGLSGGVVACMVSGVSLFSLLGWHSMAYKFIDNDI